MENKKRTLMDLVAKNIVEINNKKRARKNNNKGKTKNLKNIPSAVKNKAKDSKKFSISSILINSVINEIKNDSEEEKLEEETLEETAEEESEDKEKVIVNGGYGAVNKHYDMAPSTAYVNYDKIWEHLGSFKTNGMYEAQNFASQNESKSTGILLDNKIIEKAEKHFKYFVSGEVVGDVGYVPPVGVNINSKDWEKYRMMTQMSLYQPMLALFRAIT